MIKTEVKFGRSIMKDAVFTEKFGREEIIKIIKGISLVNKWWKYLVGCGILTYKPYGIVLLSVGGAGRTRRRVFI
jgi:hypothetical protein